MGKWALLQADYEAAMQWRALVLERCAKLNHPVAVMDSGTRWCPCGARMEMVIEGKTYQLPESAATW